MPQRHRLCANCEAFHEAHETCYKNPSPVQKSEFDWCMQFELNSDIASQQFGMDDKTTAAFFADQKQHAPKKAT